ncbi:hypothetical protein [Microbacterium sp.]|uniref:hypothetical protein n=1 Tax=Microbacterium sp. TaxID=51671 RepID=UPI002C305707|nr:hypothetical protein [Microbacterium sp.]HWL79249.1 hypothetical protein [Microbacterium sp.]
MAARRVGYEESGGAQFAIDAELHWSALNARGHTPAASAVATAVGVLVSVSTIVGIAILSVPLWLTITLVVLAMTVLPVIAAFLVRLALWRDESVARPQSRRAIAREWREAELWFIEARVRTPHTDAVARSVPSA